MSNSNQHISINITTATVLKTIVVILSFVLLYFLRDLVLVILTAVVIASAIEPLTKWFTQRKVPRTAAVISIYLATSILIIGTFFLIFPPLLDDMVSILSSSSDYFVPTKMWGPVGDLSSNFSLKEIITEFRDSITTATGSILQTLVTIFGGVINFVLIVVLSFYLAVQEKGIENFLRIVIPVNQEDYIIDLWKRTQKKIGRWMQGQLILMAIIGVLVYLGLTILGIKYAFVLALLAGLTEIIPVFGPIIAAIPAVSLGFVDSASLGFIIAGLYVIIQQFENHLIYPLVVKKVVGVPPIVVILALVIGAKLAGFLGIILSVPLATAVMELVNDIEKGKKRNTINDAC